MENSEKGVTRHEISCKQDDNEALETFDSLTININLHIGWRDVLRCKNPSMEVHVLSETQSTWLVVDSIHLN